LALRTLSKIEAIVDEELQAIGCAKLSMPIMLSSEDWIKTGRWTSAGEEVERFIS
jgi:prolyl-tRNA synthetase